MLFLVLVTFFLSCVHSITSHPFILLCYFCSQFYYLSSCVLHVIGNLSYVVPTIDCPLPFFKKFFYYLWHFSFSCFHLTIGHFLLLMLVLLLITFFLFLCSSCCWLPSSSSHVVLVVAFFLFCVVHVVGHLHPLHMFILMLTLFFFLCSSCCWSCC